MPSFRNQLIRRSRDRDFLLRTALAIGASGIALGFVASHLGPAKGRIAGATFDSAVLGGVPTVGDEGGEEQESDGTRKLSQAAWGPETIAALVRFHPELASSAIATLEPEQRLLFEHYRDALHSPGEAYAVARDALQAAAERDPPPRFANEFYGHVLQLADQHVEAAQRFRAEVERHPEADFARRAEVASLLKIEDDEKLAARIDDAAYRETLAGDTYPRSLVQLGRWWELTLWASAQSLSFDSPVWMAVTLFAGLVWFAVLCLLANADPQPWDRVAIFAVAVALGIFSAFAVFPAIYFQKQVVGLQENGELINDAIFFVSGVGLREELVKLLFFVPLLPVLIRRRSSMEALAAAGCVGLGFAVNENLGYTGLGREGELFGRFVTANFLHVAFTGIAGLALFHFIRWPKTRWEEFLACLVGVVIAHGLYDFFISGAMVQTTLGLPSIIIMALAAYRYLDLATETREGGDPEISPFGVFVIGGSLIVALSWIHACWHLPLTDVMGGVGSAALGVAALSFVFINRLRHV